MPQGILCTRTIRFAVVSGWFYLCVTRTSHPARWEALLDAAMTAPSLAEFERALE